MINDVKGHYGVTDKLFRIWSHFVLKKNIIPDPIDCVYDSLKCLYVYFNSMALLKINLKK